MKLRQNILNQSTEKETLPPVLEKLRTEVQVLKVPSRYFDSMSARIADRLQTEEKKSFFASLILYVRKPFVWAPTLATAVVGILLIFIIPSKNISTIQPYDEWTETGIAYDATYAEEVILDESNYIDNEIEKGNPTLVEATSFIGENQPTVEEISAYLKDHESDTELIIEN
jgi:hypothetical protein